MAAIRGRLQKSVMLRYLQYMRDQLKEIVTHYDPKVLSGSMAAGKIASPTKWAWNFTLTCTRSKQT